MSTQLSCVMAQYTIRHNGTGHLRSAAIHLTWYQYIFRFFRISYFFSNRSNFLTSSWRKSICICLQNVRKWIRSTIKPNTTKYNQRETKAQSNMWPACRLQLYPTTCNTQNRHFHAPAIVQPQHQQSKFAHQVCQPLGSANVFGSWKSFSKWEYFYELIV